MKVQLYGGPSDGCVYDLPDPLRDTLTVSIPSPVTVAPLAVEQTQHVAVYTLARRRSGELAYRYERTA